MNEIYPILAGSKELISGINKGRLMRMQARYDRETALINGASQAVNIAAGIINGIDDRATMKLTCKLECNVRKQDRKDARELRGLLKMLGNNLPEDERKEIVNTYLDIFRKRRS